MKKTTKNPFKMFGSYIGMIVFSILTSYAYYGNFVSRTLEAQYDWSLLFLLSGDNIYLNLLIYGSFGFLIGWGIHNLIRRFKRKK